MNTQKSNRPELPQGYYYPDQNEAVHFHQELQRELPKGHLLFGVPVKMFAASDGTDDTLFQHTNEPERFTVIHLTWIGKTEIDDHYPIVRFDGTFAGFFAGFAELFAEEERIINQIKRSGE